MNLIIAAVALLQVQVRDEAKDWKLVETANFNVYYPDDGLLPRAREFAGWFEEARTDLSARTGVEPRRIHVFLYRSYHDLQKASYVGSPRPLHQRVREPGAASRPAADASCHLNPRSRALALAEPLRDRIFIHCQASDRWNYWFAKHELAHHVQFEHLYAFRLPSWLIALKDPIVPSWWWEGGADYLAGAFDSHKDEFVRSLAPSGKTLLLVGGKREASEAVQKGAERLGVPYVAGRWVGGTLTNFAIIRKRIELLLDLRAKREKGELAKYTKKERLLIDRDIARLEELFGGLISLTGMPGALFVVDPGREYTAVTEARKMHVPVVALASSDCDFEKVDYAIPGNDAARASIGFFVERIVKAYESGKNENVNSKNQNDTVKI